MATYYVAKTGLDTNDGSSGSPFLTVQKGMDTAGAGDTVSVGAGVYDEQVSTTTDGGAATRIVLDGNSVATITRMEVGNPYNTVQNITVKGYSSPNYALVELYRGAHYTLLDNVVVDGGLGDGTATALVIGIRFQNPASKPFGTDAPSNCTVSNCEITGILGTMSLEIYGDNNVIEDCNFHDLGSADFIRFFGRSNIVRNNVFKDNVAVVGVSNHLDWVQTLGNNGYAANNYLFEGNYVCNIEGGLVQLEGNLVPEHSDFTFRNNLILDIDNGASCNIPNVKWYNNTFIRVNNEPVTGSHVLNFSKSRYYTDGVDSGVPGLSGYQWAHGGEAVNNVFLACGRDDSTYVGWYFFSDDLEDVYANYNYVAKPGYLPVSPSSAQTMVGDPAGWNNYRWWEDNGINGGDPDFYDDTETTGLGPDGIPFTADDSYAHTAGSILENAASDGGDIGAYGVAAVAPVTYYVSTTGSDAAAGSITAPWQTIQHAATTAIAGDTVIVNAGTYDERVTTANDGSVSKRITFQASGTVVMKGWVIDNPYITIDGFDITGHSSSLSYQGYVQVNTNGDNFKVLNCNIRDGIQALLTDAVFTAPSTISSATANFETAGFAAGQTIVVYDSTATEVTNAGTYVIDTVSGGTITVTTTDIVNESATDAYISGANVYGLWSSANSANGLVDGCSFSNLSWRYVYLDGTDHVFSDNDISDNNGFTMLRPIGSGHEITGNYFHDFSWGANVETTPNILGTWPTPYSDILFEDNFVLGDPTDPATHSVIISSQKNAGNGSTGLTVRGNVFYGVGSFYGVHPATTIENNTFLNVANVGSYAQAQAPHPIDLTSTAINATIQNNAFVDCGEVHSTYTEDEIGWYNINATAAASATVGGNFVTSSAPSYVTKTGWTESAGLNGGDPGFMDASDLLGADGLPFTSDDGLVLAESSPLVGAGVSGATIGAYAVTGTPTGVPAAPTDLSVTAI